MQKVGIICAISIAVERFRNRSFWKMGSFEISRVMYNSLIQMAGFSGKDLQQFRQYLHKKESAQ